MTREEAIKWLEYHKQGEMGKAVEALDMAIKALEQDPTTKNDLGVDREDAVERLSALKQLIGYDKDSEIVKATQKSLDMAIKALEQEPILDKIRAEIRKLDDINPDYPMDRTIHISRNEVLAILDKYKADREALADCYKPKLKSDLCIMDEFAFMPQAESEDT